jgi:hypothetical protein
MGHRVDDPVDKRLRAARPPLADVDPAIYDADLLARVQRQPDVPSARRPRRLALPIGAALAIVVAAALVLTGGPLNLRSPSRADAAITRALRWFDPPAGSILHMRSEMTSARPNGGSAVLVQETWQSADHPGQERRLEGAAETDSRGDLYDVATDTVYAYMAPRPEQLRRDARAALARKIASAKAAGASADTIDRLRADRDRILAQIDSGKPLATGNEQAEVGDALVNVIRHLLDHGDATVGDVTTHDGVDAFPITFRPGGKNAPRWQMWVRTSDGRPLELRIDPTAPVSLGTPGLQTVRWSAYDILTHADPDTPLTVSGAHPGANVITDPSAYHNAAQRLFPHG